MPLNGEQIIDVALSLPDSVLLIDSQFRAVWANRSAERLFGITFADSTGLDGTTLIHPDDLEIAALAVTSVMSKEVGTPLEIRVLAHDGWCLVEAIGVPLGDNVLLSMRDLTERRRWEVGHDADAQLRSLLQNASMLTMLIDAAGVVQSSSAAVARLLGHDQAWLEGRGFEDVIDAPDTERWQEALAQVRSEVTTTGSSVMVDLMLTKSNGSTMPFALTLKNLLDDPTVNGLVVSGHDITDRLAVEQSLRSANSILEATLESTADGILVVDADDRFSSFNRRFTEMWGIQPGALGGSDDEATLAHVRSLLRDPDAFIAKVDDINATPEADSHDFLDFLDGRLFERNSLPQRIDGEVVGRVWSFRDVTRQRKLSDELKRQAFHDDLTGLANQSLFRERVAHTMARLDDTGHSLAILFIDLDDFKTVNDSLGHLVGDQLLVAMSRRLVRCLGTSDTAARLGGDEFAVLIEDLTDEGHARALAERIVEAFRVPVMLESLRVVVGASVGISYGRANLGLDGSELLRNADLAMYVAKKEGKSCVREFASEMHDAAVERLAVGADLRGAAERGELVVHYQPIYQTGSPKVEAVEALVRWQHPERGLLGPGAFIAIAESCGLVDQIGLHVLEEALRQVNRWRVGLGGETPPVTVNLSPNQLLDNSLPEQVSALLERSGVPAEHLILEITEHALMVDPELASINLHRLHGLGVRLAVDDFGTGYSSLSYLQQFPVDFLKIDGSFINNMLMRPKPSMVEAIIQLAHALDLVPIAEGVETKEQATALLSFGCDLVQGYFRSIPLDADAIYELLLGDQTAAARRAIPSSR